MYLTKLVSMLTDSNIPFKKITNGSLTTLEVASPQQGCTIDVVFVNGGKDFHTATVRLDEDATAHSFHKSETKSDNYADIVAMVKAAPVKNGSYQEVTSDDGQYIGLLYQDNECEFGVVFVCLTETKQLLGIFGY